MNDIMKDFEEFHDILDGYDEEDEFANRMKKLLENIEIEYLKLAKTKESCKDLPYRLE